MTDTREWTFARRTNNTQGLAHELAQPRGMGFAEAVTLGKDGTATMNPRPKKSVKTPNYPRLSALLMVTALTGCAGDTEESLGSTPNSGTASAGSGNIAGGEAVPFGGQAGAKSTSGSVGGTSGTSQSQPGGAGTSSFATTAPPEIGHPGGVVAMPFGGTSGLGSGTSEGGSTNIGSTSGSGGTQAIDTGTKTDAGAGGAGGATEVTSSIPTLGGIAPLNYELVDAGDEPK
jgi:hypothetical protein